MDTNNAEKTIRFLKKTIPDTCFMTVDYEVYSGANSGCRVRTITIVLFSERKPVFLKYHYASSEYLDPYLTFGTANYHHEPNHTWREDVQTSETERIEYDVSCAYVKAWLAKHKD